MIVGAESSNAITTRDPEFHGRAGQKVAGRAGQAGRGSPGNRSALVPAPAQSNRLALRSLGLLLPLRLHELQLRLLGNARLETAPAARLVEIGGAHYNQIVG